jgi:flavin-dependent dehydrogenase
MNTILYACLLLAGEDVVVYGATPAGIAAALQVKRMGHSVLLLEPTAHVGGLTASGLGFTDSGDKAVVGGISREFYRAIRKHYEQPAAWTFEKRDDNRSARSNEDAMWTFEPKVAEATLLAMLRAAGIEPRLNQRLLRD